MQGTGEMRVISERNDIFGGDPKLQFDFPGVADHYEAPVEEWMNPGAVTSPAVIINLSYGGGPGYVPRLLPPAFFFYRRDLTAEWGALFAVDGNLIGAWHPRGGRDAFCPTGKSVQFLLDTASRDRLPVRKIACA